jgi:tetratricopeptide (TPR) repeat protein
MIGQFMSQNSAVDRKLSYDDATGTAQVTASGVVYSDWAEADDRTKFAIDRTVAGLTFAPDRSRPAWRDIPVSSGDPSDKHMVTRIRLPDNGAGFTLEGDQTLPATLAGQQLSRHVTLADGWITLEDRVVSGRAEVAPADIPAARQQVALAKTRLLTAVAPAGYPALWKQVEPARRAKRLDPILAIFAKQIAEAPDETSSYTERAWFLEMIYDRQGAIRDVTKALAIEASTDNYLWRARLYTTVKDDAHAIADVNAALQGDPGSVAAVNQLAQLYARNGRLDAALTSLTEHMDAGGKDKIAYLTERAELLGEAGRAPEGLALLDAEIVTKPGDPSLLNSRCWLKGTSNTQLDTALKDCTKSIELSDNPSNALDSRGMVYFRMGRMDDALADLNAAIDAVPDQAASLYMRGVIEKRTGAKGADDDLTAARTLSPRIDENYARYGIKP